MKTINKDNLKDFLVYYHDLHDSYITYVSYDVNKAIIEAFIDVYWSGEPILKDDNTYETNKTKMRIVFNKVDSCKIEGSWTDISCVYMNFVKIDGRELICFADDEENPSFYVVCDFIEYEEIG